jgi:aminoglycoside/choline kinase family phosphotransferase
MRTTGAELAAALAEVVPDVGEPVVVHGDYHYGNMLFDGLDVVAVLDWEIAAVGHRLADLGDLVVATLRRRYSPEPNSAGDVAVTPAALVEGYGADPTEFRWHVALGCLKYAAIIGFNYELHRRGRRPDPEYDRLGGTMRGLLDDGMWILAAGLDDVPELEVERRG